LPRITADPYRASRLNRSQDIPGPQTLLWAFFAVETALAASKNMRTRPEIPSILAAGGKEIAVDQHGYLLDPEDWNEAAAAEIARLAGVELTPVHWEVIWFMRDYLAGHGVAADARFVFRFLESRAGSNGKTGRALFFELFPYGYTGQACKIAGMRQPRAWSTG